MADRHLRPVPDRPVLADDEENFGPQSPEGEPE